MEGLEDLFKHYPDKGSALLPALIRAQQEFHWLSPEAIEAVAHALGLTPAHVRGVATFHVMLKHQKMGRHLIQLCTNVSCMLFGAETILEMLNSRYGLVPGGTTQDGRFSLIIMECIGACDTPPAMLINSDFHTCVGSNCMFDILERYK